MSTFISPDELTKPIALLKTKLERLFPFAQSNMSAAEFFQRLADYLKCIYEDRDFHKIIASSLETQAKDAIAKFIRYLQQMGAELQPISKKLEEIFKTVDRSSETFTEVKKRFLESEITNYVQAYYPQIEEYYHVRWRIKFLRNIDPKYIVQLEKIGVRNVTRDIDLSTLAPTS